jgi:hypothetical protein
MLTPQGNFALFLAPGAGTNSAGAFDVLAFCPENYCCPVDSDGNLIPPGPNNTDPNCQPGCNGGAASLCTATADPATCACSADLADGGSPSDPVCELPAGDAGETGDAGDAGETGDAGTPADAGTDVDAGAEADSAAEAGAPEAGSGTDGGTPAEAGVTDAGDGG